MSSASRGIRISQTITPFGVGAIYDVLGESFVATDTVRWGTAGRQLELDRLAAALDVRGFREAPRKPEGFGKVGDRLPFHRFPEWVFCSRCRNMLRLNVKYSERTPTCRTCPGKPRLVPMRFMMVCESGHLGDVDWWWWAHGGGGGGCRMRSEGLKFKVRSGEGGGLGSLAVEAACGARRTLDRITQKDMMRQVGISCTGAQPWQRRGSTSCDAIPQVVQRGASNAHFPRLASAIDIPPGSDFKRPASVADLILVHPDFQDILKQITDQGELNRVAKMRAEIVADDYVEEGATPELVESLAIAEWNRSQGITAMPDGDEDLEFGEFSAFTTPRPDQDDRDDFITSHVDVIDDAQSIDESVAVALAGIVEGLTLAHRLREVRAMTGFTRLRPGGENIKVQSPSLQRRMLWLPAIEVFGEGIFVRLDEGAVGGWERRPEVIARSAQTDQRRERLGWEWLPPATPRFLALHTLAHLLIRRLTFDCGYASASLREKIYARPPEEGEPMAGILIYTAAGDAEGSLGGLVRQGEPPRFARTMIAAAADAAWCSVDPICSESRSGPGALNAGACHACSLVAETSCGHGNLLLDRTLLVGDDETPGLLQDLIDVAVTEGQYETTR